MYAIEIPSRGGETLFADLRAAYDALDTPIKARLAKLKARHIYDPAAQHRENTDEDDPKLRVAVHPLVQVHPGSGRTALYLSRLMTREVLGMDRNNSDELVATLSAHAERAEFVHAYYWTPDDLTIWDNRSVNHARADFPGEEPRLLRRYTVSEP